MCVMLKSSSEIRIKKQTGLGRRRTGPGNEGNETRGGAVYLWFVACRHTECDDDCGRVTIAVGEVPQHAIRDDDISPN